MATSFGYRDFWNRLVGQALVMIGGWYSSQLLTNQQYRLSTQTIPEIVAPKACTNSANSFWSGKFTNLRLTGTRVSLAVFAQSHEFAICQLSK